MKIIENEENIKSILKLKSPEIFKIYQEFISNLLKDQLLKKYEKY